MIDAILYGTTESVSKFYVPSLDDFIYTRINCDDVIMAHKIKEKCEK